MKREDYIILMVTASICLLLIIILLYLIVIDYKNLENYKENYEKNYIYLKGTNDVIFRLDLDNKQEAQLAQAIAYNLEQIERQQSFKPYKTYDFTQPKGGT